MSDLHNRRDFLKTSALAALGSAAALNSGEKQLLATPAGASSVTMPQTFHKGFPTGKLGTLNVTRLFLGCNQVSGYSHSRDLKYVGRLMQEYQTDERVLNTWQLCEEQGINTVLSDPFEKPVRIMKRYRKERGGKIQWISEVHPHMSYYDIRLAHMKEHLKQLIDYEPNAFYVQGGVCDSFVDRGLLDELGEALELMKTDRTALRLGRSFDGESQGLHEGGYPARFLHEDLPLGRLLVSHASRRSASSFSWTRAVPRITTTSGISSPR